MQQRLEFALTLKLKNLNSKVMDMVSGLGELSYPDMVGGHLLRLPNPSNLNQHRVKHLELSLPRIGISFQFYSTSPNCEITRCCVLLAMGCTLPSCKLNFSIEENRLTIRFTASSKDFQYIEELLNRYYGFD